MFIITKEKLDQFLPYEIIAARDKWIFISFFLLIIDIISFRQADYRLTEGTTELLSKSAKKNWILHR